MELWLVFGLLSFLFFAVSSSIDKHMMNQQFPSISTSIFRVLFNGLLLALVGVLFFHSQFSMTLLMYAMVPSLLFAIGIVVYYRLLITKKTSELTPIYQSFDILLIFLCSIFLLQEQPTWYNGLGVLAVLIGVYLVMSENGIARPRLDRTFLPLLLLLPVDVAYALILKTLLGSYEPVPLAVSIYIMSAVMLIAMQLVSKKEPLPSFSSLKPRMTTIFGASLFGATGVYFFYTALSLGEVSKLYPLGGIQCIFVFFLAMIFLKEKWYWHRLLGTIIVVIGIFLITFQ